MLGRTIRLLKAMFSKGLNVLSDPRVMLEYELEEMKEKLVRLNDGVAKARGAVIVLTSEAEKQKDTENVLSDLLRAAIKKDSPSATQLSIANQIASCRESKARAVYSLKSSKETVETMIELRDVFSAKVSDRIREIKGTLEAKRYSDLKNEVADLFQGFKNSDILDNSDENLSKIKRDIANSEGRLEDVKTSPEFETIKLQNDISQSKAAEILKEFKKSK